MATQSPCCSSTYQGSFSQARPPATHRDQKRPFKTRQTFRHRGKSVRRRYLRSQKGNSKSYSHVATYNSRPLFSKPTGYHALFSGQYARTSVIGKQRERRPENPRRNLYTPDTELHRILTVVHIVMHHGSGPQETTHFCCIRPTGHRSTLNHNANPLPLFLTPAREMRSSPSMSEILRSWGVLGPTSTTTSRHSSTLMSTTQKNLVGVRD